MCVPIFMAVHPVDVEILHCLAEHFDLLKCQGIIEVSKINPLDPLNVCTDYYGSSFSSCQGISEWTKIVDQRKYDAANMADKAEGHNQNNAVETSWL